MKRPIIAAFAALLMPLAAPLHAADPTASFQRSRLAFIRRDSGKIEVNYGRKMAKPPESANLLWTPSPVDGL